MVLEELRELFCHSHSGAHEDGERMEDRRLGRPSLLVTENTLITWSIQDRCGAVHGGGRWNTVGVEQRVPVTPFTPAPATFFTQTSPTASPTIPSPPQDVYAQQSPSTYSAPCSDVQVTVSGAVGRCFPSVGGGGEDWGRTIPYLVDPGVCGGPLLLRQLVLFALIGWLMSLFWLVFFLWRCVSLVVCTERKPTRDFPSD